MNPVPRLRTSGVGTLGRCGHLADGCGGRAVAARVWRHAQARRQGCAAAGVEGPGSTGGGLHSTRRPGGGAMAEPGGEAAAFGHGITPYLCGPARPPRPMIPAPCSHLRLPDDALRGACRRWCRSARPCRGRAAARRAVDRTGSGPVDGAVDRGAHLDARRACFLPLSCLVA